MPLYRYKALSEQGRKISGVIDADSFITAKERLRKEQVMVTDLEALEEKRKEISLPPPLLLDFTRALGQLLRAGLPLYESLVTIEEKYRKHKVHALFLDICDHLKCGSSLSAALKLYPKSFDEVYISMVKAAEQTGSLATIFDQLSQLIARQQKLRKQLVSAITYPAFLASFCVLIIFALLFYVVPTMGDLFEGRALHPLTQTVLSLSQFVRHYSIALFSGLILGVLLLTYALRKKEGRLFLQRLSLKIPLLKTLVLQSALVRFCRSFSILLAGGVPLLDSLRLSRKVMNNLLLEQVIENAEKKIVEGKPLSAELKTSPLIPALVIRMLAISEETGNVAPMLQNIADIYEEELEKNLLQLTTLLQPILLMTLGLIVGVVLLSILIPLTDVGSLVGE